MTQMMLFDSSSLATATPSVVAASPVAASPVAASPVAASTAPVAPAPSRLPTPTAGDDGVHRMGDLARLVLLRYQLVAQRREEMAARRRKSVS